MDRIAFMIGETFIYWTSIILTLGAATAVCFFWSTYLGKSGNAFGAALAVPMAMVLSLYFSRFAHWYCRADSYESLRAAMTDLSSGGFALMGVFASCLLTALVLRLARIVRDLPQMLDCMCIAGSAGIAVGRLACFFSASDRGQIVADMTELPWVYPVTNAVSGALEYRLATFVIQAMVTGVIFVILTAVFLIFWKKLRSGDITALFLLLYGASQVALDSTRYDSLYLRSNGFISVVQILGAIGIVTAAVIFLVRLAKKKEWKYWHIGIYVLLLALFGVAGYMEYHVQRHGDQAVFAYSGMSACLAAYCLTVVAVWLLPWILTQVEKKRPKTIYPVAQSAEEASEEGQK